MRTTAVTTREYGKVSVYYAVDAAGNERLCPVDGVELSYWRNDHSKLPPYLLDVDLVDRGEWGAAVANLRDDKTLAEAEREIMRQNEAEAEAITDAIYHER